MSIRAYGYGGNNRRRSWSIRVVKLLGWVLPTILVCVFYIYAIFYSNDARYFTLHNPSHLQLSPSSLSSFQDGPDERSWVEPGGGSERIFDHVKGDSLHLSRSLDNIKTINSIHMYKQSLNTMRESNNVRRYGNHEDPNQVVQQTKQTQNIAEQMEGVDQSIPEKQKQSSLQNSKSESNISLKTKDAVDKTSTNANGHPFLIFLCAMIWFRVILILVVRCLTDADSGESSYWEWEVTDMGEIRRRRRRHRRRIQPRSDSTTNSAPNSMHQAARLPWYRYILSSFRFSSFRSIFTIQSAATTNAERRRQRQRRQQEQFRDLMQQLNAVRISNGAGPLSEDAIRALLMRQTTMAANIVGGDARREAGGRSDDFNPEDYDMLWNYQEENGPALESSSVFENIGMSSEEIDRLPVRTLKTNDDLIALSNRCNQSSVGKDTTRTKIDSEHTKCSICLESFEATDVVRTLPCFHSFHKTCIDQWLKSKCICPICKHSAIS